MNSNKTILNNQKHLIHYAVERLILCSYLYFRQFLIIICRKGENEREAYETA